MQITKIEIKKELMDIEPKPIYREAILPGLSIAKELKDGELPPYEEINCEQTIYQLRKIINNSEEKLYYVNVNEEGLFNEILEINKSDIKKEVNLKVDTEKCLYLHKIKDELNRKWLSRNINKKIIKTLEEKIFDTEQRIAWLRTVS